MCFAFAKTASEDRVGKIFEFAQLGTGSFFVMSGAFEVEACRATCHPASVEEEQPESPTCSTTGNICFGAFKTLKGDGWTVSIRQSRKGFRCNAVIDAVLPLSPDQAFDLLIDPEVKEWRQVKV